MARKASAGKKSVGTKSSRRKAIKSAAPAGAAGRAAEKQRTGTRPGARELDMLIRKTAYELYARRGYVHGRAWADWLEAERIVLSKYR